MKKIVLRIQGGYHPLRQFIDSMIEAGIPFVLLNSNTIMGSKAVSRYWSPGFDLMYASFREEDVPLVKVAASCSVIEEPGFSESNRALRARIRQIKAEITMENAIKRRDLIKSNPDYFKIHR